MIARLRVEAAGSLTTIQDIGRQGAMRFGVPRSGPIDRLAFAAAITAVHPIESTAIEVSLGGLTLTCTEGEISFALCGSDFTAEIDGRTTESWCRATLSKGERLCVRQVTGNWGYLAFAGSVDTASWLGSRATHFFSGLGGGIVRAGDMLTIESAQTLEPVALAIPSMASSIDTVGIVIGPQDRYFDQSDVESLCAQSFTATGKFDRMGRALAGPLLVPLGLDMPSEPAARGSLQIDGEGRMTMLLADHQTTGGYPKIATIIDTDIDRVAQLETGKLFRFEAVSVAEATQRLRRYAADRTGYLRRLVPHGNLAERLLAHNLVDGVVDALRSETG